MWLPIASPAPFEQGYVKGAQADLKTAKKPVRAALTDVAAGRAVATPVSRPYGCSCVKYAS